MKKTIALPLIAVLALGAAACSKKADDNTANTEASADMNAAATDAMADINAATDNASDNVALAADNAADLNSAGLNGSNAM